MMSAVAHCRFTAFSLFFFPAFVIHASWSNPWTDRESGSGTYGDMGLLVADDTLLSHAYRSFGHFFSLALSCLRVKCIRGAACRPLPRTLGLASH